MGRRRRSRSRRPRGLKAKVPFLITPGSEQVRATIKRDGQLADLRRIGATVLANACGPCIGQWQRPSRSRAQHDRHVVQPQLPEAQRRQPRDAGLHRQPELVTAIALSRAASTSTRPPTTLTAADGSEFKLEPTGQRSAARRRASTRTRQAYVAPAADGSGVTVDVAARQRAPAAARRRSSPGSTGRLRGSGRAAQGQGKCTTDHISPAGPWLRYRGHLDNISDNMFIGAINAFGEPGRALNVFSGEAGLPRRRARLQERGQGWVVVGDANYGEGSSREHAAMEPRHLGAAR
jgi:aconitate hydratase